MNFLFFSSLFVFEEFKKKVEFKFYETAEVIKNYDFLSYSCLNDKEKKFDLEFLKEKDTFINNISNHFTNITHEFLIKLFDTLFFSDNLMASLDYRNEFKHSSALSFIVFNQCLFYSIMSSKISFMVLEILNLYCFSPWLTKLLTD